jgi:DNA-binding CsgD family transcriptional regulator
VLTQRHFEIAEGLFDLEPAKTYPGRGAASVTNLVGGRGFRLELTARDERDDIRPIESEPPPSGPPAVSLPLEVGSERLGMLHVFGAPLGEEDQRLARWGARVFARGIRYSRRLSGAVHQRSAEDIHAMLERTPLTPRERDVVGRLLSGASTRQIAESTGLTVATVNTYLKRIFAKLGVHSRVELVARVTGTRGAIPSTPRRVRPSDDESTLLPG